MLLVIIIFKYVKNTNTILIAYYFKLFIGHRYDCNKEKRRFSGKKSSFLVPYAGDIDGTLIAGLPIKVIKKYVDHSPHAVLFFYHYYCYY